MVNDLSEIACPLCGKGHLLKGNMAYGCSEFKNGCVLRLPFIEYSAELTPNDLARLIKKNFKTTKK